jgi:lipopolysaccharide transport system permease protein
MDPSQRIVEITPHRGFFDLGLTELFHARELMWRFALRGLTLRYRQTALGIAWVVLQPLLASGLLALVFGTFAGLSSIGTPYVLTVYAGLLPWTLFSQTIARGSMILIGDRNLVTKTWMPRMALPLSAIGAVLVDVLVGLVFFVPLSFAYGRVPSLNMLALPLLLLPALALCAGLVLIASALNVYYRDVQQTIPFLLQLIFFASPIAYTAERIPGRWAFLLRANPLAGHIDAFRWALLGHSPFPFAAWSWSCALSFALLAAGVLGFRSVERSLSDVI